MKSYMRSIPAAGFLMLALAKACGAAIVPGDNRLCVTDYFSASGSYDGYIWASHYRVELIAGGSGGTGGWAVAGSGAAMGGAAGAAGQVNVAILSAKDLSLPATVTVGAGGAGSPGVPAGGTPAMASAGGDSVFVPAFGPTLTGYHSGASSPGLAAAGTGGLGGATGGLGGLVSPGSDASGTSFGPAGIDGTANGNTGQFGWKQYTQPSQSGSTGSASFPGGQDGYHFSGGQGVLIGPTGGGYGGQVSGSSPLAGGQGGGNPMWNPGGVDPGSPGLNASSGTSPFGADGFVPNDTSYQFGQGGAGGAAASGGARGGNGGNGSAPGGGGGGGGAANGGGASGSGGDGAAGGVRITACVFRPPILN